MKQVAGQIDLFAYIKERDGRNKMSNAELQTYLANYSGKEDVSILLASPKERKLYKCDKVFVITDYETPLICIEVGESVDMNAQMVAVCEKCENDVLEGQMEISDYPGIIPEEGEVNEKKYL